MSPEAAGFAATLLALVAAACIGPFLFARREGERGVAPVRRGLVRCGVFGALAALACGWAAGSLAGALCGAFCALYAFTAGALSDLLRDGAARVVVAALALALLATLFYWDDFALFDAANRKESAHLAFHLNAAAAASVTLDFDWLHAKVLYANNQTAESLVMVPLEGIGAFSIKLAAIAAACVGLGWWRKAA